MHSRRRFLTVAAAVTMGAVGAASVLHAQTYPAGNDPRKGFNRWYKEWHLTSEPWTFLVGGDGRVKAKFSGSVSTRELDGAIRRYLR